MTYLRHLSAVMLLLLFACLLTLTTCHQNHQQQNYQQVVNHQQQQQVQDQQFQQPESQNQRQYQQQQPPQPGQAAFQQQQYQQQPPHNGHGGHDQHLANVNLDHVLEHLDGVINKPKDQMTMEEQNFYYFKLHDYNNDNMLDGLELVSAFAHNDEHKDDEAKHQQPEGQAQNTTQEQVKKTRISDDELIKLIDDIMNDEDKNQDGYITYQEFLHAIKNV